MFEWDKEIEAMKRVQRPDGTHTTARLKVSPAEIVSSPYDYRAEDIMNAICKIVAELVSMEVAKSKAIEKQMEALRASSENKED